MERLRELTGQPWIPPDAVGTAAHAGLMSIETARERYELGTDPELLVRDWPQIQDDLDQLVTLTYRTSDHAAMGELAPALIGELHGAYLRWPQRHRDSSHASGGGLGAGSPDGHRGRQLGAPVVRVDQHRYLAHLDRPRAR